MLNRTRPRASEGKLLHPILLKNLQEKQFGR